MTEKTAKAARVAQNGVTRPSEGTATGNVWKHCDSISQASGKPALRADVLNACVADGINPSTAATQYGRWCKFNGVEKAKAAPAKAAEKKEAEMKEAAAEGEGEGEGEGEEEEEGDFEEEEGEFEE